MLQRLARFLAITFHRFGNNLRPGMVWPGKRQARTAADGMGAVLEKSVVTNHATARRQRETALMFIEQRIEPREALALPLKLGDGCPAVTRNISPSGIYLEVNGWHHITGFVVFEMDLPDGGLKLTSEGEIVRVEHAPGKTGIAVRLMSPRLQSLP